MTGDRELVGDLDASVGHNEERTEGENTVSGIGEAVQGLQSNPESQSNEPYPSTLAAGASTRGLAPIKCPVDGCNYSHLSSQGLAGHIPNASGHGHSWELVDLTAADLHELQSRRTHPKSEIRVLLGDGNRPDTRARSHIERVRTYIEDTGIDIANIQVYVHPQRKRVEIQPRVYLDDESFGVFTDVMDGARGIEFDGAVKQYWADPEWIERLGKLSNIDD